MDRGADGADIVRVLVCGGRNFTDRRYLYRILDMFHQYEGPITRIIDGGAGGADTFAEDWAKTCHSIPTKTHPAEWGKYRRVAGPIRNREMLREDKPDIVLAFAGDDGTDDMCRQATGAGVEVRRFWPSNRTQQVSLKL